MSDPQFSPEAIAQFLAHNPDFLQQHADVFAGLRVPHPNESRAISLGERQILTLRAKAKELEWRLAGLIRNASGNEKISGTLTAWCAQMLAQDDATQLPGQITHSLSALFELPSVALRLWDLPGLPDGPHTADVDQAVRQFAAQLSAPYCGPLADQPVAGWLAQPPASLAIIPLSHGGTPPFGLLVLGSDDAARFTPDMGTAFLSMLGELASAALSRLQHAVSARHALDGDTQPTAAATTQDAAPDA